MSDNLENVPEGHSARIGIVGTGFAGLGLATRLKRAGHDSFFLLDRAADIGGTWRDNTYPGAACDVPSHLYSFSFRQNPDWSRVYAPQAEILAYLKATALEEGLLPHTHLCADMEKATWNEATGQWLIETPKGRFTCEVLVAAGGHLSDLKLPNIDGLTSFEGSMFHSSQWNHDVDLAGKAVGVIGSGASAIQIVPQVAKVAGKLTVFQRSAPYVVPRPDREYSRAERSMFRRLPAAAQEARAEFFWAGENRYPQRRDVDAFISQIEKTALGHLQAQVPDPEVRAKLTPDYKIGCKRILVANDYYPTFSLPHVELQTTGIARVRPDGVVMNDGTLVPLDVLILSTGFEATDLPITHRIYGRDGQRLSDHWSTGAQAFACATVHGYPNLFIMNGPNSSPGAGSVIFMIESQISYIMGALEYLEAHDLSTLEVTGPAEEDFATEVAHRSEGSVWLVGGCENWYVDPRNGRLTVVWPDFMSNFRRENGRFQPAGYEFTHSETAALAGASSST